MLYDLFKSVYKKGNCCRNHGIFVSCLRRKGLKTKTVKTGYGINAEFEDYKIVRKSKSPLTCANIIVIIKTKHNSLYVKKEIKSTTSGQIAAEGCFSVKIKGCN